MSLLTRPTIAEFLRHAQLCAAAARIGTLLGIRCDDRLLGHDAQARLRTTAADRQPWGTDAATALRLEELLDDAVFERMERDHRQPPARRQRVERLGQRLAQPLKFVVDGDAQRLEGPR